ncbi:hypothetical protein DRQ07_06360 [candidate division KSB1 bacterium]|nr:MAG: hypothetical protein DRQ07_06360 [candidate division KSB1 bacterium]
MKNRTIMLSGFIVMILFALNIFAQDDVTIITPSTEIGEQLDLQAVSELFKDAENLEEFERALNDPDNGVNNLDLDEDGHVDFIRVVEEMSGDVHVIILQVPLGEDDFQDIATIEIEKSGDNYNMQVRGNEVIYGVDYYVVPTYVHIYTWPIIGWIYRPLYRPYRSIYYFGYYPRWWRPYPHVTINVYHTRIVRYRRAPVFTVTRVSRVRAVNRVHYKPRSSTVVTKRVTVRKTRPVRRSTTVTKTTTVKKSTPVKRNVKVKKVTTPKIKSSTRVRKTGSVKTVKKTTVKRTSGNKSVKVTRTRVRKK